MCSLLQKTLLSLIFLGLVSCEETTLQVIGFIRSGASFPEKGEILANITSKQYTSNASIRGSITGNGIRSSFILGQKIAETDAFVKKYAFRLKDFSNTVSASERSDMTTQAMLLGLFGLNNDTREIKVDDFLTQPPFNGETVTNDFTTPLPDGIYPVPFESFNEDFNNVLRPWGPVSCKGFFDFSSDELAKHNPIIDDFNSILKKNKVGFWYLYYA